VRLLLPLLAGLLALTGNAAPKPSAQADLFVSREKTRLVLGSRPFRFGGANIEWLGLQGYGPADPGGPRLPSHYEIDDAMATARELGARVVRSQTMGDSVGCDECLEPTLGRFNKAAFERVDYALKSARDHGLRIIATIVGDDARAGGSGCVYLTWRGITVPNCSLVAMDPFWTDPAVIDDVEQHIRALLDHVNVYTHIAYKNDPTILGWDLMNGGGSPPVWTRTMARFVHSADTRHLVLSDASNARLSTVDACVAFVYPHWQLPLATVEPKIAACKAAHKPFIAYEYGWDRTNYPSMRGLRAFLSSLAANPEIAGDAFWALQAHADGHGWMPIPADIRDPVAAAREESGEWWALYYPGITTLLNTAADMAARAQLIRHHDFAMQGVPLPAHAIPPAPIITAAAARLYWEGSAGAKDYSVQRGAGPHGPWTTVCIRCVTDDDNGYRVSHRGWYRLIPYNLDGKRGPPSRARDAAAGS
jgi:mannan endo-1,4-beta-mannosidase